MKPASFAIVFKDNELLLTERKDVPVWVLPGGGIDDGESPEDAAIRETLEETGLKIKILRKGYELSSVNSLASDTHLFIGEIVGGTLTLSNETNNVAFFPLTRLPPNLFWAHERWVQELLALPPTLHRRTLTEINYFSVIAYFLQHPWVTLRFLITRLTAK